MPADASDEGGIPVAPAKRRLDGIESLRAYAALSIVLFHLVHSAHNPPPALLGFVGTHFGQGVPLFFVLSGFSLGYGYFGKLETRTQVRNYFVRRFFRIAPLFYPALIFQLLYLWLGYGVTFAPIDVLLNAVFAFNVIPPLNDGIVPASWTIGVEMLFYASFPTLMLACTTLRRSLLALVVGTAIAVRFGMLTGNIVDAVPMFVYHNFLKNLPFFLTGIVAAHVFVDDRFARLADRSRTRGWLLIGAAIAAALVLYNSAALTMFFVSRDMRTLHESLWAVPFGLLCLGMAVHPTRVLSNPVTRYLGLISFSIYLTHANIVYKLGEIGFYRAINAAVGDHALRAWVLCAVVTVLIVTAVASVTYRVFELPGMNLGKRLARSPVEAERPLAVAGMAVAVPA